MFSTILYLGLKSISPRSPMWPISRTNVNKNQYTHMHYYIYINIQGHRMIAKDGKKAIFWSRASKKVILPPRKKAFWNSQNVRSRRDRPASFSTLFPRSQCFHLVIAHPRACAKPCSLLLYTRTVPRLETSNAYGFCCSYQQYISSLSFNLLNIV